MAVKEVLLNRFIGNSLVFIDEDLQLLVTNQKHGAIIPVNSSEGIDLEDTIICENFPMVPGKLVGVKERFLVSDVRSFQENGKPVYEVDFYFPFDGQIVVRRVPLSVFKKCIHLMDGTATDRIHDRDKMPPDAFRFVLRITKTTYKLLSQVDESDLETLGVLNDFYLEGMSNFRAEIIGVAMDYFKSTWHKRFSRGRSQNRFHWSANPVVAIVEFELTNEPYKQHRQRGGKLYKKDKHIGADDPAKNQQSEQAEAAG